MLNKQQQFGQSSEALAADYLAAQGYQILQLNFRTRLGEIDIIAKDGATIVFVEVKARKTDQYGNPKEAIHFKKQQKMSKTAQYYLKSTHQSNAKARFDVVIIRFHEETIDIEVVKNAFELRYG